MKDTRRCYRASELPFADYVVEGAYQEGYKWMYEYFWGKKYYHRPMDFLIHMHKGRVDENHCVKLWNKQELKMLVNSYSWDELFPSPETSDFIEALYSGRNNPHYYSSTGILATDVEEALYTGLYDGYLDAVTQATEAQATIKIRS